MECVDSVVILFTIFYYLAVKIPIMGVSFDLWKTLIGSNPDFSAERDLYLSKQLGIPALDISKALRASDKRCDGVSDVTGRHFGPAERLNSALEELGYVTADCDVDQWVVGIQKIFLKHPIRLKEPDLLATLDKLKQHAKLAVTSNTGFIDGICMRKALDRAGILSRMDAVIFSNEIHAAKPDGRIFQHTISLLGMPPENIVHIGDRLKADYNGARSVGMQAVWLVEQDRTGEVITAPTIQIAYERGYLT